MAWQRVVPQHWCAPVNVGGTRFTLRAPSGGPETVPKVRVFDPPNSHVARRHRVRDCRCRRRVALLPSASLVSRTL
eukprot:6547236-Prymnesium_polylepis.1